MMRRVLAVANAILSAGVLVPTVIITHAYIVRPRQVTGLADAIHVLLPLVPPLVALCLGVLLWRVKRCGPIMSGLVVGAFVASVAYLALQAYVLCTQFTLITHDGTAHWGMLQLPVVWIFLPALLAGLFVGTVIGWIIKRKPRENPRTLPGF
ncbi:MAG: hypothetical protein HY706_21815 [Candidatus Hydrogenedentes bacterium]|nr:hypothetical protein [Candidatus Hydrogenedentota bacterium]